LDELTGIRDAGAPELAGNTGHGGAKVTTRLHTAYRELQGIVRATRWVARLTPPPRSGGSPPLPHGGGAALRECGGASGRPGGSPVPSVGFHKPPREGLHPGGGQPVDAGRQGAPAAGGELFGQRKGGRRVRAPPRRADRHLVLAVGLRMQDGEGPIRVL